MNCLRMEFGFGIFAEPAINPNSALISVSAKCNPNGSSNAEKIAEIIRCEKKGLQTRSPSDPD